MLFEGNDVIRSWDKTLCQQYKCLPLWKNIFLIAYKTSLTNTRTRFVHAKIAVGYTAKTCDKKNPIFKKQRKWVLLFQWRRTIRQFRCNYLWCAECCDEAGFLFLGLMLLLFVFILLHFPLKREFTHNMTLLSHCV